MHLDDEIPLLKNIFMWHYLLKDRLLKFFTQQINGHGAYGEKGQKGEPAVVEPVSTDVNTL